MLRQRGTLTLTGALAVALALLLTGAPADAQTPAKKPNIR